MHELVLGEVAAGAQLERVEAEPLSAEPEGGDGGAALVPGDGQLAGAAVRVEPERRGALGRL